MKTPKPSDRPAGAPEPGAGADPATEVEAEGKAPTPPPEPMTPQRVLEWNAYYDLFVAGFALLLCFVASATIIDTPAIWSHLRAGALIDQQGGPITVEPFSFAVPEGTKWVNIPWIFQWGSYHVHRLGHDLAHAIEQPGKADQFAAGALVALNAGLRTLAALMLLMIRRRGPGLWWVAITSALALGLVVTPLGGEPVRFALGGLVGMGSVVSPSTWGLVLLVFELLLLHWAYNLGRKGALFGLVPLFALWVNVDDSFAVGLLLLAARVVGSGIRPGPIDATKGADESPAPGLVPGLITLGLGVAACLANPSTIGVFGPGFGPLLEVFGAAPETLLQDQLTLLPFGARGEQSRTLFFGDEYSKVLGGYLLLVLLGLGSFLLNRRRFDLGRLLMFVVASLLSLLLWRMQDVMAVVLAVCLALNGQEWYHSTFGTEGKMSAGWRIWSVGGRLATLGLLTAAVLGGLTGIGKRYGEPPFGFGMESDRFAFEAADFLRDAPIEGRVMNLRLSLGDALNWRAYPVRQSFVDSRLPRNAEYLLDEYDAVRRALVDGETETWQEILDRYGVSVLMVDVPVGGDLRSRLTDALDASPDWLPIYDDGSALLYGRLDQSEAVSQADRDFFRGQRLDAKAIAFGRGNPPRPFDRPPQPTDVLDRFSNTRALAPVQPHVLAARRWLDRGTQAAGLTGVPDIATCLLVIQEARDALAVRPDDPDAFLVLSIAYRYLGSQEAELLASAGDPSVLAGEITAPINLRQQQRITVLNSFIQTVPRPPKSLESRMALRGAHLELAGLYESAGFIDLTRDQIGAALELFDTSQAATEEELTVIENIRQSYEALAEQVERVRVQVEELELQGQADPAQLGLQALSMGLAETGLAYLIEAEQSGIGLATVRMQLVDVLCDIGRPDQAIPYLSGGDELSLSSGPGTAQFRQGRVYFLMGDYRTASELWSNLALPQLRASRAQEAMQTASLMLTGQPMPAVQTALNVPAQLTQQAEWEYLLGITLLEGGFPNDAVAPLRSCLELVPGIRSRPIVAYYLEQLGEEVPPLPSEEEDEGEPPASPADVTEGEEEGEGEGPAPAEPAAEPPSA
jgi:tetratricopeptide (TPR) repeat protein